MTIIGLRAEVPIYHRAKERLAIEFSGADEQTLLDTLEGLTNLQDLIAEVVRSEMDDVALAVALKDRIKALRTRMDRLEARSAKKREVVFWALQETGVRCLVFADFTLSLRKSARNLVVSDEKAIPDNYWIPQDPKLDRARLLSDLRSGEQVPGATLDIGGESLAVRVL